MAIVSVRMQIQGSYKRSPANGDFRFTRVWAVVNGAWHVVAAHIWSGRLGIFKAMAAIHAPENPSLRECGGWTESRGVPPTTPVLLARPCLA